ncbi:hypothetical protein LINPERPRIM_LOCUS5291 [Linum perenne]
MQQLFVSIEDF